VTLSDERHNSAILHNTSPTWYCNGIAVTLKCADERTSYTCERNDRSGSGRLAKVGQQRTACHPTVESQVSQTGQASHAASEIKNKRLTRLETPQAICSDPKGNWNGYCAHSSCTQRLVCSNAEQLAMHGRFGSGHAGTDRDGHMATHSGVKRSLNTVSLAFHVFIHDGSLRAPHL